MTVKSPNKGELKFHRRYFQDKVSKRVIDYANSLEAGLGDRWAKEMYRIAEASDRQAAQKKRDKPLQVAGVGHGTQGANFDVNIPVALKTVSGDFKDGILMHMHC